MKYRQIGSSDLTVSEISLGSWLTYGGGVGDDQARACVDAAFEVGINFIDTANVYSLGAAEEFLGDALRSRPRESYVLATKLYFPMDDTGENQGLSREQVHKQIEESLRRLRTEYVDLYQCHRYDSGTPLEETMEALTDVVRSGKARYIGFSEWTAPQIQASLDLSRERNLEKFVSSQPQYSMLWRDPEAEVIPLSQANGISQIVWSPLAQGALTGKYRPGAPAPAGTRATSERMGRLMSRWLEQECSSGCSGSSRSPSGSGSPWPNSRSRGCSVRRTWPRRSSEPPGPSRSATTLRRAASTSIRRPWRSSNRS